MDQDVEAIQRLLDEKKAENIKIVDIRALDTIADYFIICTANSLTHSQSLADSLEELLDKKNITYRVEGYTPGDWVLVDMGDIVVHIFTQRAREYYDIESHWTSMVEYVKSRRGSRNQKVEESPSSTEQDAG